VGAAISGVLGLLALALAILDVLGRGGLSAAGIVAAIIGAISLCLGVQLTSTGLLGEYLWRALDEGRGRPLYVVADRLGLLEHPSREDTLGR
jgi:dolichol-phosphate mannosyltransferase